MGRTAVLAVAGWVAAVVAATVAGIAVLTVVGQGIGGTSPDRPWTEDQVAEALAAATPPPTATAPAGDPTTPPSGTATLLETPAGTAIARCAGGRVRLASWSPARGWAVAEVRPGPDDEARLSFERDGDGDDDEIEARISCGGDGLPRVQWRRD